MELLTEEGSIAKHLHSFDPAHIAVAYVGLGWEKYINKSALKSIILSPTFGSNAIAIRQLIAQLGINNVYFLDHLHAKIFWSASQALVGSSNLSDNGLQGHGGLIESGVVISGRTQLQQLEVFLEALMKQAHDRYRTPGEKYKKLNKLEALNRKGSLGGILKGKGKSPTNWKGVRADEFDINARPRIHVYPHDTELNVIPGKIRQAIPGKSKKEYDHLFDNIMGFLPKDEIQIGDWILCIESIFDVPQPKPKPNGAIEWMYVDYVVKRGSSSAPYTTVAIEERVSKAWEAPFLLDRQTKKAIRTAMTEPRFARLYDNKSKKGGLKAIDALTKPFIQSVQQIYAGRNR